MDILAIILFISPWLYFIGYMIYIISQLTRGVKLPMRLVIADFICMALILFVFILVYTGKLTFVGKSADDIGSEQGAGLARLLYMVVDLGIVVITFFAFQLFFMIYFSRELKKLRRNEELPHRQEGDIF
jgi:hypothetical protein